MNIGPRSSVVQWNVPPGTASHPISRFLYRLRARLRWWRSGSTVRIVAWELCRIPLRIVAIVRAPNLRFGVAVPRDPRGAAAPHPWLPDTNRFELVCSKGIQELQRELRWCGVLDWRTYTRGFYEGSLWAMGIADSGKRNEESQSLTVSLNYPSDDKSTAGEPAKENHRGI